MFVEIGGQVNGIFRRNIIVEHKDKEKAFAKYDFKDKYSTIYQYDSKDQNTSNFIAPIYIDIDANNLERDYEKLRRDILLLIRRVKTLLCLQDDNIEIYFSGSKGFHIIIPHEIFGFELSKDLNTKYKKIATDLKSYTITKTVDTRIYDSKRLFREPNSVNSKTGFYKVQMTLADLRTMSYDDLIEYASKPKDRIESNKTYNKKSRENFDKFINSLEEQQRKSINHKVARDIMSKKELLPCVQYILANGAAKGGRNNTAIALASALFQRELNYDKNLEIMRTWNDRLEEPLSCREIDLTTRSAFNNVRDNRRYGCGAFIDLGICVKGCPVRR